MKRAIQLLLLAVAAFLSMATSRQMPPPAHPQPVTVIAEPEPEPVVVVTEPAPPPEPVIVVEPAPPPMIVVQPAPRFASPPP